MMKLGEKVLLKPMRAFVASSALAGGLVSPTTEGAPQAGPFALPTILQPWADSWRVQPTTLGAGGFGLYRMLMS